MVHNNILTRETDQLVAAIQGFIWPKVFWDFITDSFDALVDPLPWLQIWNAMCAILVLWMEWPCWTRSYWASLQWRIAAIPMAASPAFLLYQATNAGVYYMLSLFLYIRAYQQGEVCSIEFSS